MRKGHSLRWVGGFSNSVSFVNYKERDERKKLMGAVVGRVRLTILFFFPFFLIDDLRF